MFVEAYVCHLLFGRSGLEQPNVEGDIPVGRRDDGKRLRREYLAFTVAREQGGKQPPRLNISQDR